MKCLKARGRSRSGMPRWTGYCGVSVNSKPFVVGQRHGGGTTVAAGVDYSGRRSSDEGARN